MKRHLRAASWMALFVASCTISRGAVAQSTPFLGEISVFGFNFCPNGWLAPNGQLMSIQQNTALFSLLGTTYGGNGTSNFALPTVLPIFTATGAPLTQCIAVQGVFPSRP